MELDYGKIKEHWDNKAKKYQDAQEATHEDVLLRDLEIESLLKHLGKYVSDNKTVVDIGCGNAFSTFQFAKKFSNAQFKGVDYSEEMIKYANSAKEKNGVLNIDFERVDILDTEDFHEKFDIAITERCLINLKTVDDQIKAMKNIYKMLNNSGIVILSEETIQAYNNINDLRKSVGLSDMSIQWHNQYIDYEKFAKGIEDYFDIVEVDNFSSSYYLGTRFYKAFYYSKEGKDPGSDLLSDFNKIAAVVPPVGDFGLLKIIVLRKKN